MPISPAQPVRVMMRTGHYPDLMTAAGGGAIRNRKHEPWYSRIHLRIVACRNNPLAYAKPDASDKAKRKQLSIQALDIVSCALPISRPGHGRRSSLEEVTFTKPTTFGGDTEVTDESCVQSPIK